MKKLTSLLILSTTMLVNMCTPTLAQEEMICADRDILVERIEGPLGESLRSFAISSEGMLVETYANNSGGWTLLITTPDGKSCVGLFGEMFNEVKRNGESKQNEEKI